MKNGYFIVIEGCDGSGKTTLAKKLVDKLNSEGIDAVYIREPGGIPEAEQIRNIVLNNSLDSRQCTLLFMASMSLNIQRVIKPALAKKKVVVCDRFLRSTWIYQKFCNFDPYADDYNDDNENAVDLWDTFHTLAEYACFGLTPDVEFILDTSAEVAWDRINKRNKNTDVFEMLGFNHHKEICDKYINCDDDEPYDTYNDVDVEHINTDYMNLDGVLRSVYDKLKYYLDIYEGNVPKDEVEEFYNKKYGYTEEEE